MDTWEYNGHTFVHAKRWPGGTLLHTQPITIASIKLRFGDDAFKLDNITVHAYDKNNVGKVLLQGLPLDYYAVTGTLHRIAHAIPAHHQN